MNEDTVYVNENDPVVKRLDALDEVLEYQLELNDRGHDRLSNRIRQLEDRVLELERSLQYEIDEVRRIAEDARERTNRDRW